MRTCSHWESLRRGSLVFGTRLGTQRTQFIQELRQILILYGVVNILYRNNHSPMVDNRKSVKATALRSFVSYCTSC